MVLLFHGRQARFAMHITRDISKSNVKIIYAPNGLIFMHDWL